MACTDCTSTTTTTDCNEDCLGCPYKVQDTCIYLSEKLSCLSPAKGSNLHTVLEKICDSITALQSGTDKDWYKAGGTTLSQDITDNIYTEGFVGIEKTNPTKNLDVVGTTLLEFDSTVVTHLGTNQIINDDVNIASLLAGINGILGNVSMLYYDNDGTEQAGVLAGFDANVGGVGTIAEMYAQSTTNSAAVAVVPTLVTIAADDAVNDTDLVITSTNIIIDGNNAYSGSFNPNTITNITVVKGLITAVS